MSDNKGFKKKIINREANVICFDLCFGKDYQYFEGHFDDFKLLPALIQIHLVQEFVNEHFELETVPRSIPNLKFVKPITPLLQMNLEIIFNESLNKVDFIYSSAGVVYSSGSLRYE